MSAPAPDSAWTQVLQRLRAATAGEFIIQRELGRGGFAAVFLAHEVVLGRKVAIKVMSPAVIMGDGMVDRFLQEARTVASLNHPHIITIHSVRRLEELPYFVMKFVRGRSLEHVLRREGPLPVPVIRDLLFQVGSALAYAHRRGVIHRDVKPANILLDDEGNAVVTDFGIAKVAESTSYTATGMVVGTLTYMSPEQCAAQGVTWASDQYSLGIVAYEMLTGAVPFTGSSFAVMHAHTNTPPPPINTRRPDCPPDLEAAVNRMLAKDPAERWPTMGDALAALGAVPVSDADPLRETVARLARVDLRDDDDVEQTVASVGAVSLALSAPADSLPVGRAVRLSAVLRDSASREVYRKIEWRSTNPAVASITADGVVTAHAQGETSISAITEGAEASVRLLVEAAPVAGSPSTGAAPARRRAWWWVGGVGAAAAVAALAAVAVLARNRSQPADTLRPADTSQPTDTSPQVAALQLSAIRSTVSVGDSALLVATVKDARGLPILGKGVAWTTSDPAVVTVDSTGLIVARSPGTAAVTAARDGATASAAITVAPKAAAAAVALESRDTVAPPVVLRKADGGPRVAGQPPPPPPAALSPATPPPPPPRAPADTGSASATGAAPATVAVPARDTTAAEPATARMQDLAAGGTLTCAAMSGARTVCWGGGHRAPVTVAGHGFSQITVGEAHACGLTPGGEAFCWGSNSQGQVGDGSTRDQPSPVPVKLGLRFSSLSAGTLHTCGIASNGAAYCWGGNGSGQLGDGSETSRSEPSPVRGSGGWKQIAAGGAHTCALASGGEVFCWGDGSSGQLGNRSHNRSVEPFSLETGGSFKAITAGNRHSCALTNAGKAFCWGENSKGQVGDGSTDDRAWPQPVVLIEPFRAIDAGGSHTCGILSKGGLYCWGDNASGQLGDGTRSMRLRPTPVLGAQRFASVRAGGMHTCGAVEDEPVPLCWGSSARGQAGAGGGAQPNPTALPAAP